MKHLKDFGALTLGSRLKKISDQMFDDVDQVYQSQGITLSSRCVAILLLLNENGDAGITQLAEWLEQAHSSVSQMSNKLLKAGYVESKTDPADERRRLLSLTPSGHGFIKQTSSIWEDIEASVEEMLTVTTDDFLESLLLIEAEQKNCSLAARIMNKQQQRHSAVEIIPFEPQYRDDFKRLNVEWLEKYFYVEAIDNEVLSNPEENILTQGGQIFLAKYNDEVVGTAALMQLEGGRFELSKMSVTEKYQGLKIGRRLAEYAIDYYKSTDGKILFLESNSKLKPAITLYESLGFKHKAKTDSSHYERADVYMEYEE
ncbi:helix-turn-helix domain-containing GNAT family N-acetyltransferase [Pleionea sp. CnH1-48]|uniref:bifunctional helix-turn-helix transcriptional regulator/GNAT family N-acetyltransferase n=1 Tax=Pleionea sp. CnH1-48 TaxID=2954494 RepID=UPI0020979D8C|nr:helix-turn-helix domain-containing GNAT family N-acetyltransferase [Pleionea sp. CnH1-48]MCO7227032.1 bifunctional helix-turn-helix transcriptional regulator/GNAT family N-acetyltransferase [Pleionea sp. CnH1-48]